MWPFSQCLPNKHAHHYIWRKKLCGQFISATLQSFIKTMFYATFYIHKITAVLMIWLLHLFIMRF